MRLLAALAVLVTLAAPARAAGDRRAAAAHFQEGSALYAQARFSEALLEFEAGYQAYPLRGFLVNIGQCYRKLDRLDEAADAWRRFLATHPADAKLRDEVTDALAEVAALQAKNAEATPTPEAAPAPVEPAVNLDPPAPAPAVVAADIVSAALVAKPVEKKKSRRWVWAVVGVTVASLAAAAVTVGVVEWQGSTPRSGSLGLIDGRR